jgi:hypothetical protein
MLLKPIEAIPDDEMFSRIEFYRFLQVRESKPSAPIRGPVALYSPCTQHCCPLPTLLPLASPSPPHFVFQPFINKANNRENRGANKV